MNDSTLVGRGIRIKAETGDTVLLENLRLEWRDTSITYFAKVRGQNDGKFVAFKLIEANIDDYLFENPKHDDPKKIRYRLLERRELHITTEGIHSGRPIKNELFFEREFNPASTEFRLRVGSNFSNLFKINELGMPNELKFSPRPGWELGLGMVMKGAGGFLNLNFEIGLQGRFSHVKSQFDATQLDTSGIPTQVTYKRDLTYRQTWLTVGVFPEVKFRRKGNLSLVFGPYYSYLLANRVSGLEEPLRNTKVFNYNNDFKKSDLGVMIGLQWRHNLGKKDLDGVFALRTQFGLSNLDNLYIRCNDNGGACYYNGRLGLGTLGLSYSINLIKI